MAFNPRTGLVGLILLLLAARAPVSGVAHEGIPTGEAPPSPGTGPLLTMPLSEVRPGMEAIVRTVFEGDRIEEFRAEIVAVMDNFLGPSQDLILARLKGDKVEFTGVAAGMSGSPVYVDGRLVGALSYRLGRFTKEPIAGITPIEYMLGVGESTPDPAASAAGVPGTETRPVALRASAGPAGLEPIETPLVATGIPGSVLEAFSADLTRIGLNPTSFGAGSAGPGGAATSPVSLAAGQPVAAQLVTGSLSLAATGTVTMVDGDRVLAFGHPALLTGAADLPMARAEIYMTLPSSEASTKVGRVLDTIGTFRQSRLPALEGVIGSRPRMIPVTLDLTSSGGRRSAYNYEVIDHREFTPPLLALVTAASLINTPSFADEMTVSLSGRIELQGHPDVVLNDLYTGFTAEQSAAIAMARDVEGLFGAVQQNRFEKPEVKAVSLRLETVEQGHLSIVEAVYPTRTELDPGDDVEFRVLIRPYRGESYVRTIAYKIPEGTPSGPLVAYIGGAGLLASAERGVLSRQLSQVDGLDQIITIINRLRTSDRLYLKISRRHAGAIVQNEVLPALPPSILSTLGANRGTGEVTPLAETTLHEEDVRLPQIVVGGTAILLRVR